MRDRLIALLEQIATQTDDDACRGCAGDCVRCAYENVADFLLANGVIALPCNIGDTVYELDFSFHSDDLEIVQSVVNGVSVMTTNNLHHMEHIDKTVFLTKEKAEQALEEALEELKKYDETH